MTNQMRCAVGLVVLTLLSGVAAGGRLLRAMPVVPLSSFVFPSLAKPYVKGLGDNLLDRPQFKDVWIDMNWKPQ